MIRSTRLAASLAVAFAFVLAAAAASGVDFNDRVLLEDTLERYGPAALADAEDSLADAEQALADAIEAGDQEEADRLENEVIPELQAAVERNGDFDGEVAMIVEQMSDAQVVAMNRALQNTRSNGIIPTLGLDELDRILDEDFSGRQIHSFVKAYREDAKFLAKAETFEEGSKQYAKFQAKALSQRDKFLGKVDRFDAGDLEVQPLDEASTGLAAKEARAQARAVARASARDAARGAAKSAARDEARKASKQQAKQLAKADNAKAAKGLAKGKNK